MKTKLLAAAAALVLSGTALADDTTSVFALTSGTFATPYNFTLTAPSTDVFGDTNSSGISWFGVLLNSPTVPFSMLDTNPDDGFSFSGLSAGSYSLTFLGTGTGGFGGYYTTAPIPEPATNAMILGGLALLGLARMRRRG